MKLGKNSKITMLKRIRLTFYSLYVSDCKIIRVNLLDTSIGVCSRRLRSVDSIFIECCPVAQ
jgi:hypothetical protein